MDEYPRDGTELDLYQWNRGQAEWSLDHGPRGRLRLVEIDVRTEWARQHLVWFMKGVEGV